MGWSCDGANDYVSIIPPQLNNPGSLHMFVKIPAHPGGTRYLFSYAESPGSGTTDKILEISSSGATNMYFFDGAGKRTTPASAAMTANEWHGQGFTISNTTGIHYMNGAQIGTIATAGSYGAFTTPELCLSIGHTGPTYIAASYAEIGIWNVVLDAGEMAALGKGVSPLVIRPASLVRYIPLIEPTPAEYKTAAVVTVSGATEDEEHPRILRPRPAIYFP
jgi:hypothetical protein